MRPPLQVGRLHYEIVVVMAIVIGISIGIGIGIIIIIITIIIIIIIITISVGFVTSIVGVPIISRIAMVSRPTNSHAVYAQAA